MIIIKLAVSENKQLLNQFVREFCITLRFCLTKLTITKQEQKYKRLWISFYA